MKVIDIKAVAEKTTLAKQTIRNWVCQGRFPKPFKLGGRIVWDEEDINAWLERQKHNSGDNERMEHDKTAGCD